MNRFQLREALRRDGVADGIYQIPGVHESSPVPPDFGFVRPSGDGWWEVGAYERGGYQIDAHFDTEDAACEYLYWQLTGHRHTPPNRTRAETQ